MKALTKRQADVIAAINMFTDEAGYAPSYEQIGELTGMRSTATVFKHVSNLQRKGYLTRGFNRAHSIELVKVRGVKCCPTCGHRKTA